MDARKKAYCPYSKFKVGCCLETEEGTLIQGCNVENVATPLGVCAERTAYVKAVSEGYKKFKKIAVVADSDQPTPTTPCGGCRQVIWEFGNVIVLLARPDLEEVMITTAAKLLPYAFAIEENVEKKACSCN